MNQYTLNHDGGVDPNKRKIGDNINRYLWANSLHYTLLPRGIRLLHNY